MAANDDFDRIADLPDDGARQKETYAHFGLAAYWAQVFETGMVNLIVTLTGYQSRIGKPLARDEIDAFYSDLFTKTGGRLVKQLGEVLGNDPHIEVCSRAVQARNRLMHHYFRDHDQDAMTAAGMQRMVEDADATRRLFQEADAVTTEMTHAIFGKVGIGEERIAAEFERLIAEARLTDDEDTG